MNTKYAKISRQRGVPLKRWCCLYNQIRWLPFGRKHYDSIHAKLSLGRAKPPSISKTKSVGHLDLLSHKMIQIADLFNRKVYVCECYRKVYICRCSQGQRGEKKLCSLHNSCLNSWSEKEEEKKGGRLFSHVSRFL